MRKINFLSIKWFLFTLFVAFVLVLNGLLSRKAVAAEPYFKGKVISFVVPYTAGGGTDVWGRFLAKHLARFIPGKPNIVVRNMSAALGMTAGNYVWGAKPNGLTGFITAGGLVMMNLLRPKGTIFLLEKMHPVYSSPIGLMYYLKPGIIKEPKDIIKAKGLIFSQTGPMAGTSQCFIWSMELLGFKIEKPIWGYAGGGEARMAFLTGETNCTGETTLGYNTAMKPYVARGEAVPLYQSGIMDEKGNVVREPAAPDVPTVPELYEQIYGKKPSGPVWEVYKLVVGAHTFGKTLIFPTQTPEQTLKIYKDAVAEMVKDPVFLKESENANPGAPHYFGKILTSQYPAGVSGTPELLNFMKKVAFEKYDVVFE